MLTIDFETEKAACPGEGFKPELPERIVMHPSRSFKKETQREAIEKTDLTLTFIMRSHSFRFVSRTVPGVIIP